MILAAFHLAARRDRSTHQKQEPSDGYVSISCDVAKCRQSALGPIHAICNDLYQSPLSEFSWCTLNVVNWAGSGLSAFAIRLIDICNLIWPERLAVTPNIPDIQFSE
jgi:hypothetical protein